MLKAKIEILMKPAASLRIAFVTPEFPTEITTAGGLANYLGRLCPTLVRMGHSVDVFTLSHKPAGMIGYEGVRVHRVNPRPTSLWERGLSAFRLVSEVLKVSEIFAIRREGKALAQAFEKENQASPYDIIQSSDYRLSGMFIRSRPGLLHVVRCSAASTLLDSLESGVTSIQTLWTAYWEKKWLEQVNYLYAPSRFVAECKQHSLGLHVDVVRPPFFLEVASQKDRRRELPDRYLLHFGNMSRVKGSDLIEKALEIAWRTAPDLNMVWAGKLPVDKDFSATYPTLSSQGNRFIWLGPLEKPELYGVLEGAAAVVAPSRCDNLPNNVLESLACGVPVIGSLGASIDEIVEDGIHGELVPIGDVEALAASLVRAWRSKPPFDGRKFPPLGDDFEPHKAAQKLLDYVGGDPKSESSKRAKEHMQAVPA